MLTKGKIPDNVKLSYLLSIYFRSKNLVP